MIELIEAVLEGLREAEFQIIRKQEQTALDEEAIKRFRKAREALIYAETYLEGQ